MNKRIMTILVIAVMVMTSSIALLAQETKQTPSQRPNAGAWTTMQEKYKYTFQLMQMVGHIGEIDKDKKYTLTPAQAKQVLDVLKPLRSKPKLTQDQAKKALKDLKKVFTAKQLNAIARIKPRIRQGQQGSNPRANAGARPRPEAGNRNPQRRFDPNAMKDFNPFYSKAPKDDQRAQARIKRWNEFFAALEKKAKSK